MKKNKSRVALGLNKILIQKIQIKSPIPENTNAKITCDFGDDRCRIAPARLEKDIFVRTHLHTARIVVKIMHSSLLTSHHIAIAIKRKQHCIRCLMTGIKILPMGY